MKLVRVLDATVIETTPVGLKDVTSIEKSDNKVVLKPTLLNAGDTIKFKFLVTKFNKDLRVSARIRDVNQIIPSSELPNKIVIRRISKVEDIAGYTFFIMLAFLALFYFIPYLMFGLNAKLTNTFLGHVINYNFVTVFLAIVIELITLLSPFIFIIAFVFRLVMGVREKINKK